ncbi:alpha-tocopherol transfer protein-like [Caerostris extrusa]|uniref:Alpha-tocopherol transfer protein-like n=1 Tax=Caerostris extrusa TaxID=172846 RepID=A0AAV4PJT9_CAEEX|nr:alpha-tocopherol transfer protein-like [Caerostris extrusa]
MGERSSVPVVQERVSTVPEHSRNMHGTRTYLVEMASGCRIIKDNWIPEEFPVVEVKRMAPILLLQALRDPMTQVNGFKVIIDAKSNPLRHIRHCSFQNIYLMYHGSQYCLPGKFHSYHLVNQSATSRFCIALVKPFFSEELKKKIHIHSSPEELFGLLPLLHDTRSLRRQTR